MTTTRSASLMLVAVTVVWGISFPLTTEWQAHARCPAGEVAASGSLIAARMAVALALLVVARPRLLTRPTRADHAAGAKVGALFGVGFVCQTVGLAYTTGTRSAFVTALSSLWVPLLSWAVTGRRPHPVTAVGVACGMVGVAVLTGDVRIGRGETLTVVASVFFAVQILGIDRWGRAVEPAHMTPAFFAVSGFIGLATALGAAVAAGQLGPWLAWLPTLVTDPGQLARLLALSVFCTAIGFHWMNSYQPRVPAERAALIYLLESPFASLAGAVAGLEPLTLPMVAGGGLILGGNLLVELAPRWRKRAKTADSPSPLAPPPPSI